MGDTHSSRSALQQDWVGGGGGWKVSTPSNRPVLQAQPQSASSGGWAAVGGGGEVDRPTLQPQLQSASTDSGQLLAPNGPTPAPTPSIVSRDYSHIPPRPKPGRKPATDSPATKRKEQNRDAQRAYRARKSQQCDELEDELSNRAAEWAQKETAWQQCFEEQARAHMQANANHRAFIASLERELGDVRARCGRLEEDNQQINRELGAARAQRFSHGSMSIGSYPSRGSRSGSWSQPLTPGSYEQPQPHPQSRPSVRHSRLGSYGHEHGHEHLSKKTFAPTCRKCEGGGPCACLQEGLQRTSLATFDHDHTLSAMEIDFTTVSIPRKRSSATAGLQDRDHDHGHNHNRRSDDTSIPQTTNKQRDSCGFCTDSENCVCAMVEDPAPAPALIPATAPGPAPAPPTTGSKLSTLEPQPAPGSCDRCVQDPERARWCRMLAQEVPQSQSGSQPQPPTTQAMLKVSHARDAPIRRQQHLPNIDAKTSMTCDEAYDQFTKSSRYDPRNDGLRFIRQLRARPATVAAPGLNAGTSAFEVDMASVLSAMKDTGKGSR